MTLWRHYAKLTDFDPTISRQKNWVRDATIRISNKTLWLPARPLWLLFCCPNSMPTYRGVNAHLASLWLYNFTDGSFTALVTSIACVYSLRRDSVSMWSQSRILWYYVSIPATGPVQWTSYRCQRNFAASTFTLKNKRPSQFSLSICGTPVCKTFVAVWLAKSLCSTCKWRSLQRS